jgi:peptide/nickel transport system permease protein
LFALAPLARITRASMLEALGSDFVRTARASGLPTAQIVFTYAFRNALLPITSVLGMVFSFLMGSNVLIEQVFGWQGVGAYAVSAVLASDYAAVQGFVLMMAVLYILLNLAVDIAATMIDPRVRFES